MAFDFKKEYKEFYMPKNKPMIVDVPKANYIAVRGKGNPNEEGGAYQQAIGVLYSVAYTLKMSYKTDHKIEGFFEYVVPPLEGFWWQDGVEGVDYSSKETFRWISVIRLPDFITKEDFDWAVDTATKKKKMDCSIAEFLTIEEGLCVQMMHHGPFDDEPATVELMDRYLEEKGYVNDFSKHRMHHEIYLSDARKVAPEKWKTVIRHPIKKWISNVSSIKEAPMFSLDNFVDKIKSQNINMDSVMVIQNSEVIGMHRFTDNKIHNVFSVAKSFTSTAIGMAVDEGLLKLTDKPVEVFADLLPEDLDPRWNDVTLFHLLTMTSGHGAPHFMAVDRRWLRGETVKPVDEKVKNEWLHFAFSCPMVYQPGEKFVYGNLAPYVAGRMLEKACGCSINDYLEERLWKPLGIEKPRWDADVAEHTFPASDLYLDIEDMVKLGEIYLGMGERDGRRYLSEDWVKQATTNQIASTYINPGGYAEDEKKGYGFYFWHNSYSGTYRAYGREGQFLIILPRENAVIATQAMHSNGQQVLDIVWEEIFPQL